MNWILKHKDAFVRRGLAAERFASAKERLYTYLAYHNAEVEQWPDRQLSPARLVVYACRAMVCAVLAAQQQEYAVILDDMGQSLKMTGAQLEAILQAHYEWIVTQENVTMRREVAHMEEVLHA